MEGAPAEFELCNCTRGLGEVWQATGERRGKEPQDEKKENSKGRRMKNSEQKDGKSNLGEEIKKKNDPLRATINLKNSNVPLIILWSLRNGEGINNSR